MACGDSWGGPSFRYLLLVLLVVDYFSSPSLAQAHGVLSLPHHKWKQAQDREWDVGRNAVTVPLGFHRPSKILTGVGFRPRLAPVWFVTRKPHLIDTGMKEI